MTTHIKYRMHHIISQMRLHVFWMHLTSYKAEID